MKAIVYTGLACTWCARVKALLQDNDYEIEEIMVNKTILEEIRPSMTQQYELFHK